MDLQLIDNQHRTLLEKVNKDYSVIKKATNNFNKSQSQFMDNMLTVTQLTPLRSARQCLAEIKKSKLAIEEAFFKIKKIEIEIDRREYVIKTNPNEFDRRLFEVEQSELRVQKENILDNVNGAIRKISNFMTQYKNILKKYGKKEFTEEDFEKDEERYHIMKVFEQGLNAARSRGGIIDEGNFIYFFQIGISGTAAQIEIKEYFKIEDEVIRKNKLPTHSMTLTWLEEMADKYSGSAQSFAEYKGMELVDNDSLLTRSNNNG